MRNLTCVCDYCCREDNHSVMERLNYLVQLYNAKCMTVEEYEEMCDLAYELGCTE